MITDAEIAVFRTRALRKIALVALDAARAVNQYKFVEVSESTIGAQKLMAGVNFMDNNFPTNADKEYVAHKLSNDFSLPETDILWASI